MSKTIESWQEYGHKFRITDESDRQGRKFRLYDNGSPAYGGQWHHTIRSAKARADYILLGSYSGRISWLEMRVNCLERKLYEAEGS
jgi:hypothetical protein